MRPEMNRSKQITIRSILQLKATLKQVAPSVWRRLHLRNDTTLAALHECLQTAFGWADSHLHSFSTADTVYGPKSLADDVESTDERTVAIRDVFRQPGAKLRYDYD